MSASPRDGLISVLVSEYADLRRRLTGRLGSADAANEALQDTYVRLRRTEGLEEVRNPRSYLLSMAINIAINRFRSEARHLSSSDIEKLIELPDETPGPEQIASGRSDLATVERALEGLPERRRAMFRRFWIHNKSYKEIAVEFNVSERTIRNELLLGTRHLHKVTEDIFDAPLQKASTESVF